MLAFERVRLLQTRSETVLEEIAVVGMEFVEYFQDKSLVENPAHIWVAIYVHSTRLSWKLLSFIDYLLLKHVS